MLQQWQSKQHAASYKRSVNAECYMQSSHKLLTGTVVQVCSQFSMIISSPSSQIGYIILEYSSTMYKYLYRIVPVSSTLLLQYTL